MPTNQLDIDFGQQLTVEQRTMLNTGRVIDLIPSTQSVQAVWATGMLAPRNCQSIDHPIPRDERTFDLLEFPVQEPQVETGIVNKKRRIVDERDELICQLTEEWLIF